MKENPEENSFAVSMISTTSLHIPGRDIPQFVPADALRKSIEHWGLMCPIIVVPKHTSPRSPKDIRPSNEFYVIDGVQRLLVCNNLGAPIVSCFILEDKKSTLREAVIFRELLKLTSSAPTYEDITENARAQIESMVTHKDIRDLVEFARDINAPCTRTYFPKKAQAAAFKLIFDKVREGKLCQEEGVAWIMKIMHEGLVKRDISKRVGNTNPDNSVLRKTKPKALWPRISVPSPGGPILESEVKKVREE